jgi:hypothetical protein
MTKEVPAITQHFRTWSKFPRIDNVHS